MATTTQARDPRTKRWVPDPGAGHNQAGHKPSGGPFKSDWMSGPSRGESSLDWGRKVADTFHIDQFTALPNRREQQRALITLGSARQKLIPSKDKRDRAAAVKINTFITAAQSKLHAP